MTSSEPSHVGSWGPTEDGFARAFVAHHGHEVRFCPQRNMWLIWNGSRWSWDRANYHRELIRALARKIPDKAGWRAFRTQTLKAAGISATARMAESDAMVVVDLTALDAQPWELNTPAGIIDLKSGRLRPPDPTKLHTRSTPVAPDFARRSATFDQFLADTFGDDHQLATYVQRLMGLSAIGVVLERLLPFAHGPGANGKSTLLEAAMHALGTGPSGYATAASSDILMARPHADHPTELAQLFGTRMVVCSELDVGQRFAEARVKLLTGRDSIPARYMRADWFSFVPSHLFWLMGNHRPDARAGGPAFWRRVRLLPFTNVVPPERENRYLGEQLIRDAGAVLAWIVQGAADYHAHGLAEPPTVRAATAAYARDEDSVGQFVEECCVLAKHGHTAVRVGTTEFREAYQRWCAEAGEPPVSAKRLTQELRERFGVTTSRGTQGRRLYTGVGLLGEDAAAADEMPLTD